MGSKEITLAQYRKAIRAEWRQLVGRGRFSSCEYDLTDEWYKAGIPVSWVLRAIDQVRSRKVTVYSLGVIKADLEGIKREQARLRIGEGKRVCWLDSWRESFQYLADNGPEECAEIARAALEDLPKMTNEDQAAARFLELKKCWERYRKGDGE
jgi:hypothetical protein